MTAVVLVAAALIGLLFWADRRFPRTRYYYGGPVIISDGARAPYYEQDAIDNDVETFCDDYQDGDCTSNVYGDSVSTIDSRDE